MGCMYELTFPVSEKGYIGITTVRLVKRMKQHQYHAEIGTKGAVYDAWRKYGKPRVRVLMAANDWDYLCLMEKAAIVSFGTKSPKGYNVTDGGEGIPGVVFTDESKERISIKAKGRVCAEKNKAVDARSTFSTRGQPRAGSEFG